MRSPRRQEKELMKREGREGGGRKGRNEERKDLYPWEEKSGRAK